MNFKRFFLAFTFLFYLVSMVSCKQPTKYSLPKQLTSGRPFHGYIEDEIDDSTTFINFGNEFELFNCRLVRNHSNTYLKFGEVSDNIIIGFVLNGSVENNYGSFRHKNMLVRYRVLPLSTAISSDTAVLILTTTTAAQEKALQIVLSKNIIVRLKGITARSVTHVHFQPELQYLDSIINPQLMKI
jgi:hypothetical protein